MARVFCMVASIALAVFLLVSTIAPAYALDLTACWGNCGVGDPRITAPIE